VLGSFFSVAFSKGLSYTTGHAPLGENLAVESCGLILCGRSMSDQTVRKKDSTDSLLDLVSALKRFAELLVDQSEGEAAAALLDLAGQLSPQPEASKILSVLKEIRECFDGDHELGAYTLRKSPTRTSQSEWSPADALYVASTSVATLVRRLQAAHSSSAL
jgi:hypothetical protein